MTGPMTGMNARTGKPLSGAEHLRQSIMDILATPIGTRVRRRDYGSSLHALIDAPITPATLLRFAAAAGLALARWEPRLKATRIRVRPGEEAGQLAIHIEGEEAAIGGPRPVQFAFPLALSARPSRTAI